ncbi:hypothetical protein GGX14DRAFT_674749 [Mycena pura]|uniref:Uncharacterized protein n=1 Tax=Mycena pura TaxID=153505 RepID=A0AAD6UVX4_9AGAR|nr:hypothetical protein GGX14DRAFT_674749 [Mycena pura]
MAETVTTPATIELNDMIFCTHFKEVCTDCDYDGREDNDAFYGFDPIDREGIEAPAATLTKDGVYQCKKHASTCECCTSLFIGSCALRPQSLRCLLTCAAVSMAGFPCSQCYGWKKQITRLRTAAKKAGKK